MRRAALGTLAIVAAVSFPLRAQGPAAPAAAPAAAAGAATLAPPEGALVGPGPAPSLILLYTGDVIGYIEPCG